MTIHETRATPSPPSTAPSPNDTTESNASDSSEMEPEAESKVKTDLQPTLAAPNPTRASVSDSDSVKTRDVKRVLMFPKGNNQSEAVSIYLEIADPSGHGLPDDWHVCAQFTLALSHPDDPTNYYSSTATHRFMGDEIDWGFTRFYELKLLNAQYPRNNTGKGPFIVNNQAIISVFVRVVKDETGVLWHNFTNYDSRKETGYVGIKNQGATCYMNSLLQSLYCTNSFRRAVYQIPTDSDKPTDSVSLALQRCFYNLQYSDLPIGTTELTKSFGWDSLEAFRQHDVQEFNRVLQDRLEEKMKGTPADGAISKLFRGKMKSYIKCVNVEYESSRVEDYYDIQLNVKGCKNLDESFKDYVTVETLEGENKYMAEGHGLQDAHKGVIFDSFPPVLHLQLKRFEYDFMRDTMVKINDRHEFPEEINLDAYCSNTDPKDPNDYELHGGDMHGHYFALIKPEKDGKWLRFDDDRVTPVTRKEVFEENFGDENVNGNGTAPFLSGVRNNSARLLKRFTNAYMLVYVRKSKLDEVLGAVIDDNIPPHLKRRVSEERAALEKRRRDREEMHLHVKVAVVTDKSFLERQEFDLAMFDDKNLEVTPGVHVFKVPKTEKIVNLKQELAEHFKLHNEKHRLWSIVQRTNKTVRVEQPLTPSEEKQSVEKLRAQSCVTSHQNGFAKLYLEIPDVPLTGKFPSVKSDTSMVFLKYFDVKQQKMIGMGHLYIKAHDKVGEIIPALLDRAKLPKDTQLSLYEEVKPTMIEFMNPKHTFHNAEIQNGDIICFQIAVKEEEADNIYARNEVATVREYYSTIFNRVLVEFKPRTDKQGQEVSLKLDRRATYGTVAKDLAKALNADYQKLMFTTAHSVTRQPKDALAFSNKMSLESMVSSMPPAQEYAYAVSIESVPAPILYYDILDVNLSDFESKESVDVTLLHPTLRDDTALTVLVPRRAVASDLAEAILAKSQLEDVSSDQIRVFGVASGKITLIAHQNQTVAELGFTPKSTIYAEVIPDDEASMDPEADRLIEVVSYHKDPSRLHGIPFLFVAKKDELFADTKKRLQQRLGIGDKEWQKVKCTIIRQHRSSNPEVEQIDKDDYCLVKNGNIGPNDVLGLDRVDKTSRSSRFGSILERGIFIRG
ncbi:hypothetical protein BDB00DRAFT_883062 [Zychaea mexicana]|uniref:uncharacterized protein n=1 Tax=Zychaea mexicana TaxID=64656 RepID=UPI0022FEAEA8|nr:uncharacterized protein BDB00DRAFT_883062 [Zychaea mexicana]KAI9493559.1 hypothetical protein BDB00DRAFT_883062 [Zychaea mexicana]